MFFFGRFKLPPCAMSGSCRHFVTNFPPFCTADAVSIHHWWDSSTSRVCKPTRRTLQQPADCISVFRAHIRKDIWKLMQEKVGVTKGIAQNVHCWGFLNSCHAAMRCLSFLRWNFAADHSDAAEPGQRGTAREGVAFSWKQF